ncbi:hypothetical protein ADN00_15625 [Ornatilinea apprima]|uniref:Uncharacterized protein n=1 Tax=Ornatilinea apprima TaxID=1134406 RepID=A0A0P6WZJ6_9CHLR|nr:hypothetical protein [Ornatilinea apprima]KPL72245.1 hypothetical protein ADN00_15625 [Ornatilinea apprima]
MSDRENVLTQVEKVMSGADPSDLFFDWFCRTSSLKAKGCKLVRKLEQLLNANQKGNRFDPNAVYTIFKNNCPLYGKLYDDIRICDLETGKVLYTIVPSSGFQNDFGTAILWGKDNDFSGPILEGQWKDILAYFSTRA